MILRFCSSGSLVLVPTVPTDDPPVMFSGILVLVPTVPVEDPPVCSFGSLILVPLVPADDPLVLFLWQSGTCYSCTCRWSSGSVPLAVWYLLLLYLQMILRFCSSGSLVLVPLVPVDDPPFLFFLHSGTCSYCTCTSHIWYSGSVLQWQPGTISFSVCSSAWSLDSWHLSQTSGSSDCICFSSAVTYFLFISTFSFICS